ncbi:FK506-binding protein 5-like isoform X2 [Cydia strobilella]|uniref:FK506-binding protein 5-like isoform X2 n=1 Tax=Cydia strobilella TaxID=1100964 RepID=UPI00300550A2
MSNKSLSKVPSPARSQDFTAPRRRTRRTLSSASTAQSEGPLSTVVEKFVKSDKFVLSPMKRPSMLPDDTDIEAPRRASWWKRLEGSSRDVLEALDTNKMTDDLLQEYESEVEKDDKQSQSVQQSQSSDNESVASIVVPQQRLFNQKRQTQAKFDDIMGSRKSLGKTYIENQSIEVAPKNLFNKGPRNRPVFPDALLNSTNKTINKTVEPETNKQTRPNLFGQVGNKRKNMFTDFVFSDSEEDSEVQHKVFGFKKNNNKRVSLGTRSRRMPSLTPSNTTEIDNDDWILLPSSTMIGAQEASRMSDTDMELQDENQDNTLTEDSVIQDDENDKTLTNENIDDADKGQDVELKDVSKKVNKTHEKSKTELNTSVKYKSFQNKSNVQIEEVVAKQQQNYPVADKITRLAENEQSLEDKMAELHGESGESEKRRPNIESNKTEENPDKYVEARQEEACKTNEDVNESEEPEQSEGKQEESEEEPVQSVEEPEQSEEEQEQTEEDQELSLEEQENQNQTDEATKDQDEDMVEKDKSEEEKPQEDQDEDMEEMVWNDNEDEKLSDAAEKEVATVAEQNNEVMPNQKNTDIRKNLSKLKENADKSKNISNKSHKIVDASVDNDQNEEDIVEETPNNSTHNTTNRKKEVSKVKSPEAVLLQLQDMTNDNESFRPIGRSTTFRKSKSVYETMNMKHSLAPVQESTLGSEGSRNSSTEGSEWDSHRTTRKTIRQTLGKEYTTRKSLRALVMEQSAKRQTELYNKTTTKFDKTKNKTVTEDGNDKNASKMNKSKNKTVVEDDNNKNASNINKTRNKTVIEDANSDDNASKDKTKNKTVSDDINDQHIRDHRSSNRNISSNRSPILESPVHGTSIHHVPDPLISEYQTSYHKSLHDSMEPEISENPANPEESVNIPIPDNNDSGPEISMNASYGQGMSASGHEIVEETLGKDISRRGTSIRSKSIHHSEEVLDYEASEQVISGLEDQENEFECMQDERESEPENEEEMEQSEQEIESEQEDSQQEIEADSEHETQEKIDEPQETKGEQEQSQQEIESEHEQSQQEMESDQEESQQEIEDEQDQSQQEMESDQEESQQEIEDEQDQSQQEMESDQEESQQEIEDEQDQSQQEMESDQEESQQEIEDEQDQSQQEIESDQEESQQEIDEQDQSKQEIESDQDESQQELEDAEQSQQEMESEQESEQEIEFEEEQQSDNEDHDMSHEQESDIREPENDDRDNDDFISALNSKYKTPEKRGVSLLVFDSNMMSDEEIDFEGVSRQTDNDITENNESERELSRPSVQRVSEPRVHDVSVETKRAMLMMQMQKIAQANMERRQKIRDEVQKSLKPTRKFNLMSPIQLEYSTRHMAQPKPRKPKLKPKPMGIPTEALPKAFVKDLTYKPPKRFQPANASWITKRLYKFLETKLEPKYDYRARVRAEELVQTIFSFTKLVRRHHTAPPQAVDELKREMARLRVVNTHYEFYDFFHEFMPREIRIKVNPDVVNKIPMPRNGVFSEILLPRTVVE